MTQRKRILKLEALIDALEDSKKVIAHNRVETEVVIDKIIDLQRDYKKLTGEYYHPKRYVTRQ